MRKVALITGAGRGIGFGIAMALAAEDCDIVICDIHDPEAIEPRLEELRALGADAIYCRADVTSAEARAAMLETIREHFGRLNVLVNNAGVAPRVRADLLDATEESYDWVMGINLRGPYFLTQAVARWMIEQKTADPNWWGCIINTGSISATVASTSRGEYCLSKAGVGMATKLWAVRLGEYDIPVYEFRPGIFYTDMTTAVKEKYDKLIDEGLLIQKRWGFPEDAGKVVAMMVRGDIAYSTGQVIMLDGGGFGVQRL